MNTERLSPFIMIFRTKWSRCTLGALVLVTGVHTGLPSSGISGGSEAPPHNRSFAFLQVTDRLPAERSSTRLSKSTPFAAGEHHRPNATRPSAAIGLVLTAWLDYEAIVQRERRPFRPPLELQGGTGMTWLASYKSASALRSLSGVTDWICSG